MGGRETGYMGPGPPGQRSVLSTEERAFVEVPWGLSLHPGQSTRVTAVRTTGIGYLETAAWPPEQAGQA